MSTISIHDKKEFIRWFLRSYQLKRRESVWILNYLVNHDMLLENVHFVREAQFCPRGIVISSYCSEEVPFRFYKNHLVTTDAEKSFHDIRLNREEAVYIQLNFRNAHQCAAYAGVLEDNPFLPEPDFVTERDRQTAKVLLEKALYERQKKQLRQKIDQALDAKDREDFSFLVSQLRELEERFQQEQQ